MKLVTFKCNHNIVMDVYNNERVPKNDESTQAEYFITPKRLAQIEKWKIEQEIEDKLGDKDHLDFFISKNWIQKY